MREDEGRERAFWYLIQERFRQRDFVEPDMQVWAQTAWTPDRRYLTFLVSMASEQAVARAAADVVAAIEAPGVPPIDPAWLHMTVVSIGFADQIPADLLEVAADEARAALHGVHAFDVRVAGAGSFDDAAALWVEPWDELEDVRRRLVDGVAALTPVRPTRDLAAADGGFAPHVSVSYYREAVPARPVSDALDAFSWMDGPAIRADEVALVSVIPPAGAEFTWEVLERFSLAAI